MLYYLFSLLSFFSPTEINIGCSLDWMVANSDIAAVVKIGPCSDLSSGEYDMSCLLMQANENTEMIKGKKEDIIDHAIYSRLTYIGRHKLKGLYGKELLVFLKKDKGDKNYIWEDDEGLIVLSSPGSAAFTGDFKVLDNKADIISYVIAKEKLLKDKKAEPRYLEVPYETPAYGVLYQGSSCFLMVPDVLYPKARKSMSGDGN